MRTLIVDDEKSCTLMTSKWMKCLGYDSDICYDGYEAIRLLQRNVYDLVITDLSMPDMSGVKLANYIKDKYEVPILLMTGYDEFMTDKLGFEFVFKKGKSKAEFSNLIHTVLVNVNNC